ncbi:MAG TPA: GspH/FimT family pseudopilin [Noviherbaspirillum sp.]|nr:GspH/FimT family pseudopilin [Noviherbaspirillum sp.]
MKVRRGFTLIEMMISIAILAVLLGLAAPGFQTFIRNTQIRTTADSLQAGMQLARSEALRRNARVSFWLVSGIDAGCARTSAGTSWVVSIDDPTGACNASISNTVAPRLIQTRLGSDGSSGITINAVTGALAPAASSCITFNGFGTVEPVCPGGGAPIGRVSIVSTNSPNTTRDLQVRIASGGSIRMCDPDVPSSDASYCGEEN